MKGKEADRIRIQHIFDAIYEIKKYVENRNFDDFLNDSMFRFACIKQLEIIGEASNHITIETKTKFQEIEWQQIIGMRNVFIHEYFGIDLSVAWEIIEKDIPDFKKKLDNVLNELTK
ncbi:MAG TPA: DUF86 domain-containing protein [Mariniphaga anaerophila]|uniref:DUF86 domain-containing protein n=1 Tax=Mariniphaga anaerophila TaxID=1484053 RepID=A0A831LUZ3_9BACT|nr:DUF86 domain-containing protein [Mariniphaga anaerophila]